MDTNASRSELEEGTYRVRVATLISLIGDPFEDSVWACRSISLDDVLACPVESYREEPGSAPENFARFASDRDFHIGRVAHLMHHGWDESAHVPTIEFSIDEWGDPLALLDGNHRFAAAVARGDEYFTVAVDGDIDAAKGAFGVA